MAETVTRGQGKVMTVSMVSSAMVKVSSDRGWAGRTSFLGRNFHFRKLLD